jgi:hypothetical protein
MTVKNKPSRKSKPIINKTDERGHHFSAITINNFRCFKEFSMSSFERINLIGGKNNVGKTTLLEALFLLLGATNISLILKINAFRGIETFTGEAATIRETLWNHLFHDFNNQAIITVNSELGTGNKLGLTLKQIEGLPTTYTISGSFPTKVPADNSEMSGQALELRYTDITGKIYQVELRVDAKGINLPPPLIEPIFPGITLPARFRPSLQENAARYGKLEMSDSHYDLVQALKIVEPGLKRLATIVGGSGPMLYGDIGLGRMLPLSMMGDGLGSLATLLLAISSASGGVVLIDEIENGFHYSILEKVWQAIAETARRYNTQIFATTHSFECIEAAHTAFQAMEKYDFRYHRLQKTDDTIEARTLDQDTLQNTIESGWEIR